eukprot:5006298-Prymnesium_polylepis.1
MREPSRTGRERPVRRGPCCTVRAEASASARTETARPLPGPLHMLHTRAQAHQYAFDSALGARSQCGV